MEAIGKVCAEEVGGGKRRHRPAAPGKSDVREQKQLQREVPRRRSRRVAGESVDGEELKYEEDRGRQEVEEKYGIQHVEALGQYNTPWELFQDGYDAQGNRIYDKVNGLTCHQCRQKTLGKRTSCSKCDSLQGVFCGDCLFMRYGENIEEVLSVADTWVCPTCRDLCNCSFHRTRKGWAPTGTLYRRAITEGFASVAHYLVLNNLEEDESTVARARERFPECVPPQLGSSAE